MEPSANQSSQQEHKYNTRYKHKKNLTNYKEMSDDNDSDDQELDPVNYQEFLAELFPSKYMKNKAKATKQLYGQPTCNIIIAKSNILNGERCNVSSIKNDKMEDSSDDSFSESDYLHDSESLTSSDSNNDSSSENDSEDDSDDSNSDNESETDEDESKKSIKKLRKLNTKFKMQRKATSPLIKHLVLLANKKKKKLSKKKDKKKKVNKIKEFEKLIDLDENMNDVKYFKKELDETKKDNVIEELKKISSKYKIEKPYRILVLEADIPSEFKIAALKKISMLESMDPSASEYFKLKSWIDSFMRLPFNKVSKLPISINDGLEKCSEYMKTAVDTLDNAVYGLNDAKMQIMQLFGQWITNPDAVGTAIAIKGPMGTGKTTLVKEGISKMLNRPFDLIALGGATDASVLEGHGYTYEGSMYGKIADILIQTQCSNPIIYFDELDKVSDTPKGEEIIGILTHLIDTSQNANFHDKYFSEINFDLSKALFIFSYNDESKINPILRDRMYRITTKGYNKKDKNIIAKNYLLPAICKQVNFEKDNIVIEDTALDHMIDKYTEQEAGVRNLKRCLEIIYTKLNLYRLMPADSSLFKEDKSFKVEFPFTVTTEIVDKLIKKEVVNENWKVMYM